MASSESLPLSTSTLKLSPLTVMLSVPVPTLVTRVSIRDGTAEDFGAPVLRLAILSDGLRYELASLDGGAAHTGPQKLGQVTRLMATYCSRPVLFARAGEPPSCTTAAA